MKAIERVHAIIETLHLRVFDLKEAKKVATGELELAQANLYRLIRDKTDLLFNPETGEVTEEASNDQTQPKPAA
ncbi:MAG: hypothetical protein V3U03_17385 [Myxococcota bacterium]